MTVAAKKVEAAVAAPSPLLTLPGTLVLARPLQVQVILMGAGGTGARVATMLSKMLRRNDRIVIIDPDVVEERNLHRQHFIQRDVGRMKSQVIGDRLKIEAARVGFQVESIVGALTTDVLANIWHSFQDCDYVAPIVLGCVDNRTARAEVWKLLSGGDYTPMAYIDAGNELRGGQVVLSLSTWPMWSVMGENFRAVWDDKRKGLSPAQVQEYRGDLSGFQGHVSAATLHNLFPALLKREEKTEGPACELVIDLQSVAANALAATWMGVMLSWLVDEVPTSTLGVAFSSLGTMTTFPVVEATVTPRGTVWVGPKGSQVGDWGR
jgi:hypothetical protein